MYRPRLRQGTDLIRLREAVEGKDLSTGSTSRKGCSLRPKKILTNLAILMSTYTVRVGTATRRKQHSKPGDLQLYDQSRLQQTCGLVGDQEGAEKGGEIGRQRHLFNGACTEEYANDPVAVAECWAGSDHEGGVPLHLD